MIVKNHGQVVVILPAAKLADEAPVYHRDSSEPEYLKGTRSWRPEQIPDVSNASSTLMQLLESPIASKNWVYRQYDYTVRNGTVIQPGSDAAVIRLKKDSLPELPEDAPNRSAEVVEKYVAMSVDGNGSYVYLDPYEGGKIVVAEAARNLACSGAVPLGTTDNLNFGNPHHPELFWQLKEAVRGLAEACHHFEAPVTGGNVSLYNQNPKGAIDPTPTVAMVGLIKDASHITTQWFKQEETSSYCSENLWIQKIPARAWGDRPTYNSLTGSRPGCRPAATLMRKNNCTMRFGDGWPRASFKALMIAAKVVWQSLLLNAVFQARKPDTRRTSWERAFNWKSLKVCVWMLCFLENPRRGSWFPSPPTSKANFSAKQKSSVSLRK